VSLFALLLANVRCSDGHRFRATASYGWRADSRGRRATADMAARLCHVLIAARFKPSRPDQPTPEEISILRLAREDTADLAA
jgi:hypothetical protein